ncbi:MAG: hypothetical protein NPINA01_08180 [Nitrospinaceae bacterium]|nr:MAG: hypothetical protein NPINA01_08180 [Nitrospinaceae bacterium]
MKKFGAFPIKTKLIIVLLFVSFATLVTSSTFFIYNDLQIFKKNILKNLTILAGTVGANSRAAVYFDDKATAATILSSLKENSNIQYAAIYDLKGNIFVTYEGQELTKYNPTVKENSSHTIDSGKIGLKRPIFLKDQKIGEIYLSADLKEYHDVLKKYLIIVGIIILVTFAVALAISFLLQKILSKPILTLVKATKEISNKNDYSIRVNHDCQDEIGELYMGFNQMISNIEKREKELATTNTILKSEIEQRRIAEQSLKLYSKELKRSNQELHDFATIASHDLQEPLRKIITFGDRLTAQISNIDEKSQNYLERMQNAAQRMKQFIDDLLEYSKVGTKAKPFEETDLNKVFSGVLENLETKICKSNAQISCDPLPTLQVDSFQIHQLFQNLVANAIKFKRGDEPPVVEISARTIENGFWEFVFKDNGIGFDEKYLDRIFKPFERLHGKNEYEGSGMGLTICKKITNRHGGNIIVSSIPQEGSCFRVILPETQIKKEKILPLPSENYLESVAEYDLQR